jgi:hypothetical protein
MFWLTSRKCTLWIIVRTLLQEHSMYTMIKLYISSFTPNRSLTVENSVVLKSVDVCNKKKSGLVGYLNQLEITLR